MKAAGNRFVLFAALLLGGLLGLAPGCLERRNEPPDNYELTRCTGCHGDPNRKGDYLARSAPPGDLYQSQEPSFPGVGAHQLHLNDGPTHRAFPCNECHIVPDSVDDPGHADDGRPAEVVFGELAKTGGREPEYDPVARRCTDTYCHRDAYAVWTRPRDSDEACGSCHGLPPGLPHPQSEACHVCHAEVVDAAGKIKNPDLHVDGRVEYHAGDCAECHGDDESPAPPVDTHGNVEVSAIGVGAHRAHLGGGSWGRPLACDECHRVPEKVEDPAHIDGSPAEVIFEGVGTSFGREPSWYRNSETCAQTWCHSPLDPQGRSPKWTSDAGLQCGDCHGLPPPLPHPQSTNCQACHADVVGTGNQIIDRMLHVNGHVEVDVTGSCTACHGGDTPAPPVDLEGHTDTNFRGVGAHQTHLVGTGRSRVLECTECHRVPDEVLAEGHLDSNVPAEVVFSGVATARGTEPVYDNGTCLESYCHGANFASRYPSGGSVTEPSWTQVDGSQNACGSCHGLPPPLPHPQIATCADCHANVMPDQRSFKYPELHVNGITENRLQ